MKTFEIGKIYVVRKENSYTYLVVEKDIVYIGSNNSFLVLKQGVKENEYVVLVLTGNNKGRTGFVWFALSSNQIEKNFNEV